MRTMYKLAISLIIICLPVVLAGQDRKEIRDREIVSKTTEEYFIEEGIDDPVVESEEKYNKDGELIELKEFNSRGEVKLWEKYVYDEDRNLLEEIYLDSRGRVVRTEKNLFEDGLRVEKQYYNSKNQLYKKKVYVYEYRE